MSEAAAARTSVPAVARAAPGLPRIIAAAVVASAALAAVVQQAWYRGLEAASAARFVHAVLGLRVGLLGLSAAAILYVVMLRVGRRRSAMPTAGAV